MPTRSIVYVDGFNLYYGAVRGTQYKWLNLQRYFDMVRNADDIQSIHYFTALVDGPNLANQEAYLAALETLPKVNIILGKFKRRSISCGVAACTHAQPRTFSKPEEKRTDVNIALQMLDDAYQQLAERFVLVSGDSDLVPAVDMVKARFPNIEIVVSIPASHPVRGAAVELRAAADKDRTLPRNLRARAQFPNPVRGSGTTIIQKPASW